MKMNKSFDKEVFASKIKEHDNLTFLQCYENISNEIKHNEYDEVRLEMYVIMKAELLSRMSK